MNGRRRDTDLLDLQIRRLNAEQKGILLYRLAYLVPETAVREIEAIRQLPALPADLASDQLNATSTSPERKS